MRPPALPPASQPPALPRPAWLRPAGPSSEERTLGMLCHLLAIFTGFPGPLILWLVKKDGSPFVNHHGKEALNFQLTVLLVSVVATVSVFLLMLAWVGFVLLPVLIVIPLVALILEIIACAAANRGQWHRYPLCIPFIS